MHSTAPISIGSARARLKATEYPCIDEPGAYVIADLGLLLRVSPEGLARNQSPVIELCARKPLIVYQISADPWISINRARALAANHDLLVMF